MVSCGHQLGSSDDADWLLSSSAATPICGTTSAALILNSLIADGSLEEEEEDASTIALQPHNFVTPQPSFLQSQGIRLAVARHRQVKFETHREGRLSHSRVKVQSFHDFSDFDDDEHLDGCPVKWLFRRQSSDSVRSLGSALGASAKTTPGLRDKVPREISIRKIGLSKRLNRRKRILNSDKVKTDIEDTVADIDEEWRLCAEKEDRRTKLAAKVNFRPFDDEEDDYDDDQQIHNFRDCLLPRPLPGLRPWLCVLLAPRLQDNCCNVSKPNILKQERSRSPSVSIHSIHLPQIADPTSTSRPHGNQAHRWAGTRRPKTCSPAKVFKAPPQLTIELLGEVNASPPTSNLLIEDQTYRLRRFLSMVDSSMNGSLQKNEDDSVDAVSSPLTRRTPKKPKILKRTSIQGEMEVVCSKAQFFTRPGKPMR